MFIGPMEQRFQNNLVSQAAKYLTEARVKPEIYLLINAGYV